MDKAEELLEYMQNCKKLAKLQNAAEDLAHEITRIGIRLDAKDIEIRSATQVGNESLADILAGEYNRLAKVMYEKEIALADMHMEMSKLERSAAEYSLKELLEG